MIPHVPVTATLPANMGGAQDWIRKAASSINLLIGSKLEWASVPAASSDPGASGQAAYDEDYLYIHDGTEWRRIALTTW